MKRGLVIVLAIALVGGLLWWRSRDADTASEPNAGGGSGSATIVVRGGNVRDPDAPPPKWFARAGVKDRRIAGRVLFEGKPHRARVSLHSLLTTAGARPVVVETADDGTFDFGPRPAASFQVVASADGLVAAVAGVDLADPIAKPPPDHLELVLQACTITVSGTIYDSSGGTIAGAHVRRNGLVGADTDAHGLYRLCVPRGSTELEFSADGYGGVILGIEAHGELVQNVVLVPEGAVNVTVLRALDGKPVDEALVYVNPKEWGRDRRSRELGITGPDGRVRVGGLTPGAYRIWASARSLGLESPVEAVVEVGTTPEVVIKLTEMARISGRVMRGKTPVAGASVVALRKSPLGRSTPSVTQEDGSFVIEEVPPGDLIFTAHPYEVTSPTAFHADTKRYDDVEIQVEPRGRVHGIVTRLGKPIEGAEVCCINDAMGRRGVLSLADGSYELLGVPAGPHELLASFHADAFVLPTKFVLEDGGDKRLDFELDQAGTITGTVVDKQSKPVPNVFVMWLHEKTGDVGRCTTDVQGRYRCGAMTGGGTYRASVLASQGSQKPFPTADGGPYPTLAVKDGKTLIENIELEIDLQKLQIAGRVVDDNGAGIADAQVRATLTDGQPAVFNTWQQLSNTFTDADGNFTLGNLTAGTYALQARSAHGGEGVVANITAGSTGVTIKLLRPAGVEGKLVGFVAPPVVYAVPLSGGERWTAGNVDGATFAVRGLSPGRYIVTAQTTYEGDGKVVTIESGKVTPLTLTSRGRATIDATIVDFKTNAPVPAAACHAVIASEGAHGVTNWDFAAAPKSDASGHVVLDPAPAGSITVECGLTTQKWSMPSADLTVEAGGRATIQLYAVELSTENPSDPGVYCDRYRTQPVISAVKAGSSAAKAGVLPGDVVISVDGASVTKLNASGVDVLLRSHSGGDDIVLGVQRGTATKSFTFFATQ